jgi:hypothetical protein
MAGTLPPDLALPSVLDLSAGDPGPDLGAGVGAANQPMPPPPSGLSCALVPGGAAPGEPGALLLVACGALATFVLRGARRRA